MKITRFLTVFIPLLLASSPVVEQDPAWGFFGHRRINRMAVFTLDPEMMPFFRANLEYLTDHAVDPDKRRYAAVHEAVRHYIDIDHWGTLPFENVPRDWAEALLWKAEVQIIHLGDTTSWFVDEIVRAGNSRKAIADKTNGTATLESGAEVYSRDRVFISAADRVGSGFSLELEDYRNFWYRNLVPQYYEDEWTLSCQELTDLGWPLGRSCTEIRVLDHFSEYGILPYHLLQMKRRLTAAFEQGDAARIIQLAAEFGHYLGDGHVPLHTTENYNGQLTNQVGIHGFWESRIPELLADSEYDYFVGKAAYIEDPKTYFWDVVLDSHALVDSVLNSEKRLSETFPEDEQYCFEDRLDRTVRTYCPEYATAWAETMRGMVEERFRSSIHGIGSIWYTCWIDAGQPDLNALLRNNLNKSATDSLDRAYRGGQIKGREHGK